MGTHDSNKGKKKIEKKGRLVLKGCQVLIWKGNARTGERGTLPTCNHQS